MDRCQLDSQLGKLLVPLIRFAGDRGWLWRRWLITWRLTYSRYMSKRSFNAVYIADCSICLKALCLPGFSCPRHNAQDFSKLNNSSLFRWTRAWGSLGVFAHAAFTASWAQVCPIPDVMQLEKSKAFCEGIAGLVVICQALVTHLAKHLPRSDTTSSCLSAQVSGDLKILFCRLDIGSQIYQTLFCWNEDSIWDCALRTASTASSNLFDKVALLCTGRSWWCAFVIEDPKMRDIPMVVSYLNCAL